MGILGNFRTMNFGPYRNAGGTNAMTFGNSSNAKPGLFFNSLARSGATTVQNKTAFPTGYYPPSAWRKPITSGEMSWRPSGEGDLTANLFPSKNMTVDFTGSSDFDASASLAVSMLCAMTGSGTLTATIQGRLNMIANFTGSGDLDASITGLGNMIVSMLGSGDLDATIAAFGDMSVDIVVTGTGLSTANVGQAVWAALASSNNVADTMGELLNMAGAGGLTSEQNDQLFAALTKKQFLALK